jgi:hypothetical protein
MTRAYVFLAFLALATLGPAHAQTTWHVDGSVPGPGSGSPGDPYASIRFALQQSTTVDGDTVLVAPGLYVEKVSINKRVTVKSSAGPLSTAIRAGQPGATVTIGTGGFPFPVLEGFTVYGSSFSIAIHANDGDVKRCIVIGDGHTGEGLGAVDLIRADHCTVYGFDVGATGVVHGGSVEVTNSIVHGNNVDLGDADATFSWYGSSVYYGPSGLGPPGFFDGPGHDFHLLAGSGCIDAGDPAAPTDPDGSRTDMGAVVFDPAHAPFTTYCTAKTNSLGCVPAIGAVHNASLSSDRPFWVTCTNQLNHRNGFLFYGFAPKNTPYQGGYLCVMSPTRRTQLQTSGGNLGVDDCSGEFALDFNALIQGGSDPMLELGTQIYCQWWSRDPDANFHTSRSDALRFTIGI